MFPYFNDYFHEIGLDNYRILMVIGIVIALFFFRFLSVKTKMPPATFNFFLLDGILSLVVGLYSAFFFQAIYSYKERGEFVLVGMTVMGGILGAAIFFTLFTLLVGLTKFGKAHKKYFWDAVSIIIPCLVIAQCFGRLGCFSAGCCYGKETDSWLGMLFVAGYTSSGMEVMHEHPRLPTQLFEAIFLLILFIVLLFLILKLKRKNISALIYMYSYSIFRFFIEFLRDDNRGDFLLGLSPSQLQCILLLAAAVTLTILIYKFNIIPFKGKISADSPTETDVTNESPTATDKSADVIN